MSAGAKARAAAQSAHLLLEAGLFDDAVNRAYYAMFDVAREFLLLECGIASSEIRRHASLITRFSQEAVLSGRIAREHGRALARAFDDRMIADYGERLMAESEARTLIRAMDDFIAAIREASQERREDR